MNTRCRFLLLLLAASTISASALTQDSDLPGSKDHPMVSRFQGSVIARYSREDFGALTLPLSNPLPRSGPPKSERLEGNLAKFLYRIPAGHGTHEVFRSYQTALQGAGFRTLYTCVGKAQCGIGWRGYIQGTYGIIMGLADNESQRYLGGPANSS